jgi:CHAT domain-containing protein
MGRVYSSLGNYQQALESYNQTLSIQRAIGDRGGEAQTLDSIGGIYQSSGDHQRSLDFYNQSLSVWRADKNRFGEASTLTNIVRVYDSLGDYQKALDTATQARSLWTEINDPFGVGSALIHMGRVYRSMGNYQLSLDSLNQGLSIMRNQGHRLALATALANLGKTYDALGESEKTLGTYTEALSVWRTIGDRAGEAEALYNIAGVERKRGNLKESLTQMESVIEIVESLRTKVASQELRSSYFASVQKYYEFYIDLLMQLHKANPSQGYAAKALQASESSRARGLLEILTEANADIRQGVDPKLLDQERSLQQQLDTLSQRQTQLLSGNHTPEQATALEKEISALLAQYQDVQVKIRATSPRYAALTQPQPLTLAEIQQQVLDEDTLLLEYSLGEERSYLWAVSKTGITSYELPKRADIEAAAQAFRDALTVPSQQLRPAIATKAAKALSDLILAPVANQLGNKRLAVVRDGALEYIPFAALAQPNSSPDNKQYEPLVVAHEIVTLPSASTVALLRRELNGRQPAPKAIAVLADPVFTKEDERVSGRASEPSTPTSDENLEAQQLTRSTEETGIGLERLPFTRNEAEQILSLVPNADRDQAFDFAASRAIATSPKLSKYRIVHFATHGILNSVNPELSGVVLSLVDEKGVPQNGFLRLHDVFNLNLPAELVVLSACQTGLGQEVKGEGLVGLTRGFMYAGAPRVMVSLWNVYDEGTSELMARFYKKMLQEKLKPAAALRAAQIEMLQEKQWQAPYYWAAFVLQGEWK